jgi:hypothetical protein
MTGVAVGFLDDRRCARERSLFITIKMWSLVAAEATWKT